MLERCSFYQHKPKSRTMSRRRKRPDQSRGRIGKVAERGKETSEHVSGSSASGIATFKTLPSTRFIHHQTRQASAILMFAILTSVMWNRWTRESVDYNVRLFLREMCKVTSCHSGLSPTRRTQRASRSVPAGERLLVIPKENTIWDVDALRNNWIAEELFETNEISEELSGAAYLGVHLARLFLGLEQLPTSHDRNESMHLYIHSVLPSSIEDFNYHPIRWSNLKQLLHGTYAFERIIEVRKRIRTEYETFQHRSSAFSQEISFETYQLARLNVMTRSFGTGPTNELTDDPAEMQHFREKAGVDLSRGCYAMVPILDLYDHHARPNVGFSYKEQEQAFVVESLRPIQAEHELFDSYGKRTDSDLLAHFGFVNGDGSEYTDASLALWHSVGIGPVDPRVMLRYLQYDDGYEECVSPTNVERWEVKKLKFEYLKHWAEDSRRWSFRLPPRNSSSLPPKRSDRPITTDLPLPWDMHQLKFDGSWLFSTCRLISLTHSDYEGRAKEVLTNNLLNATFVLPPTKDALEFRTLMCVARMAKTAQQKVDVVPFPANATFQSPQWISGHIRLAERQALDALKQTSFAGLQVFRDRINSGPEFTMNDRPCSRDFLIPLVT